MIIIIVVVIRIIIIITVIVIIIINRLLWRQHGQVGRVPDLKSGEPEFKSQLVWLCLLPIGILNLLSLFQLFLSDH